jgi:hypothetical protein
VPFFGAFGAAWDDAMVARWSANPLGMLWPEMDAGFVAAVGGNGGSPATARRSGSHYRGRAIRWTLSPGPDRLTA